MSKKSKTTAAPATTAARKPRGLTPHAAPPPPSLPLPELKPAEWRFVVFTDLHVSGKTIDRSLRLLDHVRATAKHYAAPVVCLGDFWDQRAALAVRHLDLIQREFEKWGNEGVKLVIVPGNHDQVSMDGAVNAVRIFDGFPHITVATEPYADPDRKLAFIPWREEQGKQAETFAALPGEGWTIFAHAEVAGALANSGKEAIGRVGLDVIEAHARACYVGHYHKRQKLGSRTWYIGSPFEMNFGERNDPHGIAIVDSESIEPCFLDLPEFPRHHRFTWPEDGAKLTTARPQDIVEVYFKPDDLGGPALRQALGTLKAHDVRPLPLAQDAEKGGVPQFALTLGEGVKLFADEYVKAQAALGSPVEDDRYERLVTLGRKYLAQVPDSRTIAPISPLVRILSVRTQNFCALKNSHVFDLQGLGPVLIRGRMGIGKTSVCDAITWALYGATTPRKPGERAGSLRADDVVHDEADETMVRVEVTFDPPDAEEIRVINIERTKKRGQGAKLKLLGADALHDLNGITDTQEAVHRIIGLDLDLWRATVYLGQGAVANFVTDADKKRKEVLSRAFGLGACDPAQKIVRDEMRAHESSISLYTMRENEAQAGLDALARADFATQSAQWDAMKVATLEALVKSGQEADTQVKAIEPHLATEAAWLERRASYDTHIDGLTRALASGSGNDGSTRKLATELGAAEAELSMEQRELSRLRVDHQAMMQARDLGQPLTCKACGQTMPGGDMDAHLGDHEEKIQVKQREIASLESRVLNLRGQMDAFKMGPAPDKSETVKALEEARAAHAKCNEAIAAIARMKEAKAQATHRLEECRARWIQKSAEVNPFTEKAAEIERSRESYRGALADAQGALAEARRALLDLQVWEEGFGAKGVAVLVLRTALYELELHANAALASMLSGRVYTRLAMDGDDLVLKFYEYKPEKGVHVERTFYQLSGGQRRCVELAFSPFALSEMIFARCGVRVKLLVVDELTTHLDPETKPLLCNLLRALDRETVLVIDHDAGVQGEFDVVLDADTAPDGSFKLTRAT